MINISYGLIYPPTPEIGSMVRWNIIDSYCKIRPKLCLQIVVSPFLQISWEIIILAVWEPWFMQNMITSSNGNIFRVSGTLWGKTSVTGGLPSQRPVTWSFGVFFDLTLNKRLSKQSRGRWLEKPSSSLWRNCNGFRGHTSTELTAHEVICHNKYYSEEKK